MLRCSCQRNFLTENPTSYIIMTNNSSCCSNLVFFSWKLVFATPYFVVEDKDIASYRFVAYQLFPAAPDPPTVKDDASEN